jgi:hypothetical protein
MKHITRVYECMMVRNSNISKSWVAFSLELINASIGTREQQTKLPKYIYTSSRKTTSNGTKDSKNKVLYSTSQQHKTCSRKICTLHFLTLAPTIGTTMRETKASPPRGSGQ